MTANSSVGYGANLRINKAPFVYRLDTTDLMDDAIEKRMAETTTTTAIVISRVSPPCPLKRPCMPFPSSVSHWPAVISVISYLALSGSKAK